MINPNPAHNLVGMILESRWEVTEKITRDPDATGGTFSVCYNVRDKTTKKIHFLKALNMSQAFGSPDPTTTLYNLTKAYNFERDLLRKCVTSKMKRVTLSVFDGVCTPPGPYGIFTQVPYLIFEMGDADIRVMKSRIANFDGAWILRSLHHAAVGIKELHSAGVMHQDLKPSNVVQYQGKTFKVSDLGRAWDNDMDAPHDSSPIPGDQDYAPPESFYGRTQDEFTRKKYDLYSLGGLIFFHFLHNSPAVMLTEEVDASGVPCSYEYDTDMPCMQTAFAICIMKLKEAILKTIPTFADELSQIAFELCNPDYKFRGHPDDQKMRFGDKCSIERYISRFDYMAKRIESKLV